MFDVREETKRLSDELTHFRLAAAAAAGGGGVGGSGSGRARDGSNKSGAQQDSVSMEQLLRGMEEKVGFVFCLRCFLQ